MQNIQTSEHRPLTALTFRRKFPSISTTRIYPYTNRKRMELAFISRYQMPGVSDTFRSYENQSPRL